MKRLLLPFCLWAISTGLFAQTELLNEDFNDQSADPTLSFYYWGGIHHYYPHVDQDDPGYEIFFFDYQSPEVYWQPETDLSIYDTIFIEYKLANYHLSTNVNANSGFYTIDSYSGSQVTYMGEDLFINASYIYDIPVDEATNEQGFVQVKTHITGPYGRSISIIPPNSGWGYAFLESINNGAYYEGYDMYHVIEDYCAEEHPNEDNCFGDISANIYPQDQAIKIDDIKVTGAEGITTSIDNENDEGKTLVKVYNALGQEMDKDTKGEMLFFQYNDGSIERVFN